MYKKVKENGHEIVGVFTIPDTNNREDPVAAVARYLRDEVIWTVLIK